MDINLRAWYRNKMYYNVGIVDDTVCQELIEDGTITGLNCDIDDCKITQSINKIDINDKLIYIGDIVNIKSNGIGFNAELKYSTDQYYYYFEDLGPLYDFVDKEFTWEVISNIFEK